MPYGQQSGNWIPVMRIHPRANGERLSRWYTKGQWAWQRGEQHRNAKLREGEVMEMRQLREEGWTIRALAVRYNVSHQQVWRIVHREQWTHV